MVSGVRLLYLDFLRPFPSQLECEIFVRSALRSENRQSRSRHYYPTPSNPLQFKSSRVQWVQRSKADETIKNVPMVRLAHHERNFQFNRCAHQLLRPVQYVQTVQPLPFDFASQRSGRAHCSSRLTGRRSLSKIGVTVLDLAGETQLPWADDPRGRGRIKAVVVIREREACSWPEKYGDRVQENSPCSWGNFHVLIILKTSK